MEKRKKQSSRANQFHIDRQPGSRFYSIRLMVDGQRRRFSTGETGLKAATAKATVIMADIKSRGFEKATRLHSMRRDEIPADPTIEEFTSLYRSVITTADSPPSQVSSERYIRCLERVCHAAGVKRILRLDATGVERFKDFYLQGALPAKDSSSRTKKKTAKVRDSTSVRTTLNGILRNAAAMFSQSLLATYQVRGLTLVSPFAGTKLRRVPIKPYSPLPRALIDLIWMSAALLRDGDPQADAPDPKAGRRSGNSIDFRVPHPDAFAIFLLELGLGLRRNEADKAEWTWVIESHDDRRFIEVRATDIFTPKSKQSRVIPIDPAVWEALVAVKSDARFIVPGPEQKAKRAAGTTKSVVYRCDTAHRVLVFWLQKAGVRDAKPCHALRKEFGSYVATCFSLFHAQKLLGHSTPAVTSAYYASLTDLPHLESSRMGRARHEQS